MDTNLGQRIRQARLDLAQKKGDPVSAKAFGKLVAWAQGKKSPYTGQAVSEWEAGRSRPSLEAIDAMSRVTGTHREIIAWGAITDTTTLGAILVPDEPESVPVTEKRKPDGRRKHA